MRIRSDYTLKSLLLTLHEHAPNTNTAGAIMDVLDHMGALSPFRGGNQLLELLEFARKEASDSKAVETSTGVEDAIGYATGKLLEEDLKGRYSLYNWSGQDDVRMAQRMLDGARGLAASELDSFLRENPDASIAEIHQHFSGYREHALRVVRARRAGHYGAYRIRTGIAAWLLDVMADRINFIAPPSSEDPRVQALMEMPDIESILAAVQVSLRRTRLDEIRHVVENKYSSEQQIQFAVSEAPWLFGGQYIDAAQRRRITQGIELDIPLLRPDGTLHAVELKKSNVRVIKPHRNGHVPTAPVYDAVGQMANYLLILDERRDRILTEHGIDSRRAMGTVVIGHSIFQTEFNRDLIDETIRTHTSHLSRINVITYENLLDNAFRSLSLKSGLDG